LPQLFENLFAMATPDKPYMVQIAATKEILDRLLGKPQVMIDAVTTKVDVAQLYLNAMRRANAEIVPSNSHVVPSADADEKIVSEINGRDPGYSQSSSPSVGTSGSPTKGRTDEATEPGTESSN
jgi:hypothetical protein